MADGLTSALALRLDQLGSMAEQRRNGLKVGDISTAALGVSGRFRLAQGAGDHDPRLRERRERLDFVDGAS